MYKYGFIGTGNMGFPLLKGAVELAGANKVCFASPFAAERERVSSLTGATAFDYNGVLASNCENIVLAVKPAIADKVFEELASCDLSQCHVISIMAGVSIERIMKGIDNPSLHVTRVMPNTPAMVGEGMACICFNDFTTDADKDAAVGLLQKVGKTELIPEKLMNAATCANGSSPAYVYMFIEALADSVVKYGIPRDMAYRLAAQTVLGSAKMVLETGAHPGALKDNVCSPGGTTIAAVEALEEYGFRNAVMKATDECYKRCL